MKLLKTLTLLISLSSLFILPSCSDGFEDFPAEFETTNNTKASEPNDSTGSSQISILVDEPEPEDIDYVVNIP